MWTAKKIRFIYELYQRDKVNKINDAIHYDNSFERAFHTIRYLFLSLIKSSFDLDLFYYCFNNIKHSILTAYPYEEMPLALKPKYGLEIMFNSIEQECEKLTDLLQTLKENNLRQSQLKHSYIYTTVQFIKECYMTELTLSDIAAAVHMNSSYLTRKFKEKTGVSVIEYLTKIQD